jgi:Ion channel
VGKLKENIKWFFLDYLASIALGWVLTAAILLGNFYLIDRLQFPLNLDYASYLLSILPERTKWQMAICATFLIVSFYLTVKYAGIRKRSEKAETIAVFIIVINLSAIAQTILCFADVCTKLGIRDTSTSHMVFDGGSCMYFSSITWTTVGYGDFVPSPDLRLFASSEAILGYLSMGVLVAGILSFIAGGPEKS